MNVPKDPGLTVFKASTLEFVGHQFFPGQVDAPWVTVNPQNGIVYSSDEDASKFNRWKLD